MRHFFALTAATALMVVAFALIRGTDKTTPSPRSPSIFELRVTNAMRTEAATDPKFPSPVAVAILAHDSAVVFARTAGIGRLDVLVELSATESFGTYSGWPDRNGFVKVEVPLPAAGSRHDFRVPGPDGRRIAGQIRPGMTFLLVTTAIVDDRTTITGDPIWVRLDE